MWADTVTTQRSLFALLCVLTLSNSASVDDWEVCLLWEASRLPTVAGVYVQANRGCHATDAVATCRPDWQARLQTDVHAALWSSVLRDTATVMNTRQLLDSLEVGVLSQASVLHVYMQVPEFTEEKHLLYKQVIFKSVDLSIVTVPCPNNFHLYLTNLSNQVCSIKHPIRPHFLKDHKNKGVNVLEGKSPCHPSICLVW